MYKESRFFEFKDSKDGWIYQRIHTKKEQLMSKWNISLENFTKSINDIQNAQKQILFAIMDWKSENEIEWDNHDIEIQLSVKNKYILRDILESIWTLYVYENENNDAKIKDWLDLLSPQNKNTDEYILKIKIRRRNNINPFYIENVEIIK